MRFDGRFTVKRTKPEVLAFLRNAGKVARCLPGAESVKAVDEASATLVLKVGVSFVRGPLTVKLQRVRNDEREAVYRAHAAGLGSVVDIEAGAGVQDGPETGQTSVSWYGEASVGGTLASVASGLVEPVVRQNLHQFVDALRSALETAAT